MPEIKAMPTVERIPLFDLHDNLLGHSCRVELWGFLFFDRQALERHLGFDRNTRGLEINYQQVGRGWVVIEWFQSFGG